MVQSFERRIEALDQMAAGKEGIDWLKQSPHCMNLQCNLPLQDYCLSNRNSVSNYTFSFNLLLFQRQSITFSELCNHAI